MVVSSAVNPVLTDDISVVPVVKTRTTVLLFRAAKQRGLQPEWIQSNGLFAVTIDGVERYVNFARSPLNTNTGVSIAADKYSTRLVMERRGLPNIPYLQPASLADAEAFLKTCKKIIVKPMRGSGSRNIHIVTEPAQLQTLDLSKCICEQYVLGKEMRYLTLNGEVIGVHQSDYGTSVAEDRPLKRISYPRDEWDPELMKLSLEITSALDLKFSAVDFLIDATGQKFILEVNTSPGLKWFHAPTSGPAVDVAGAFIDSFIDNYRAERYSEGI